MATIEPPVTASDPTPRAAPGFWWRMLLPIAAVAVGLIALLVSLLAARLVVSDQMADAIATTVGSGVILGMALMLVQDLPAHERRRIFARKASLGVTMWTGLGAGLGFVVLTAAIIAAGTAADPALRARTSNIPSPFGTSVVAGLVTAIGIVALAPLGEELLFRGIMLRGLVRRMPFWPAAVISGTVFAMCHSDVWSYLFWPRLIALALTGTGLAYLNRTRGYWCGVTAHATINALATIALLSLG